MDGGEINQIQAACACTIYIFLRVRGCQFENVFQLCNQILMSGDVASQCNPFNYKLILIFIDFKSLQRIFSHPKFENLILPQKFQIFNLIIVFSKSFFLHRFMAPAIRIFNINVWRIMRDFAGIFYFQFCKLRLQQIQTNIKLSNIFDISLTNPHFS